MTGVPRKGLVGGVALAASVALAACSSASSTGSSSTAGGSGTSTASAAQSTSASSGNGALTNVVVGAPALTVAVPVYVAQKEGFFKKNGLNVTIDKLASLQYVDNALLSGKYDISVSTAPGVIVTAHAGLHLVTVAGNTINTSSGSGQLGVEVLRSSGITSLSQLAGKSVGVAQVNGNVNIGFEYKMAKLGVTNVHYTTMLYPSMQSELDAGRVAAVEAATPFIAKFSPSKYRDLGDPFLFLPTVPNLSAVWISNTTWANSHATAIKEYQNALREARSYMAAHPSIIPTEIQAISGVSAAIAAASAKVMPTFKFSVTPQAFAPWLQAMEVISPGVYNLVKLSSLVVGS